MLNKKIIFMAILLISLLSLSAVSAADDVAGDIVDASDDAAVVESIDDVSNAEPALEESDEKVLSDDGGDPQPDSGTGTFTDLAQLVHQDASEITLDKNYAFDNESDNIEAFISGINVDRDVTIYGNGHSINANNAVRIFYTQSATITFYNITFIGGNSISSCNQGDGGAIYALPTSITHAINCTFIQNTARDGGALYNVGAINCTFTNNTANSNGGAIAFGFVENCTFTNNKASESGGAIFGNEDHIFYAKNCTFTENSAKNGGALYRIDATDCTFTNNNATNGGAIKGIEEYPDLITTIRNCTFTGNTAKVGGAAYDCIVWDSNFTENQAIEYGGALIYCDAINCNFNENTARVGGAIDVGSATLCNFTKNSAEDRGGATSNVDADRCTFLQNSAGISGGAMDGFKSDPAFECTFIFNRAPKDPEVEYLDNCYECTFIEPTFTASDLSTTYNSGDIFPFELSTSDMTFDGENTTIKIYSNDVSVLNDTALTGSGWEVNLDPGMYKIELGIPNSNVTPMTKIIVVGQSPTSIAATSISTTYNVNKDLVITLKDNEGNPLSGMQITVDLNGAANYTTDENGQVKIAVGKLVPKTYTAAISFAGDEYYKESSATAEVTVQKIGTAITASAKTFKFEDTTKKYTVTLKDAKGNLLKNTKVTLKVNGKTYTATTNSKGVATFKLTGLTKKGTYSAVITYAGDKYYSKVTKNVKLTVKEPAWETIARGSKKHAMVKKIQRALKKNGFYLSYKGHYLKIDGIFHIYTEMAVKQFQKAKKLKVTGKVDYETAKKLKLI